MRKPIRKIANAIESRIRGHIDQVKTFDGGSYAPLVNGEKAITILRKEIRQRSLELVVPTKEGTPQQMKSLQNAAQYAKDNNINVRLYKVE